MNFWDSSALIPLLVAENDTALRESQLRTDPDLLVWYGTHAEIESAICRRLRENSLDASLATQARARLLVLSKSWLEVQPTPLVKARAIRLLRVHPLRAADAFQLAAALTAFHEITAGNLFLTADLRLATAAALEGFDLE
jgi:predicted nucleic acid-binding protein